MTANSSQLSVAEYQALITSIPKYMPNAIFMVASQTFTAPEAVTFLQTLGIGSGSVPAEEEPSDGRLPNAPSGPRGAWLEELAAEGAGVERHGWKIADGGGDARALRHGGNDRRERRRFDRPPRA